MMKRRWRGCAGAIKGLCNINSGKRRLRDDEEAIEGRWRGYAGPSRDYVI